MKVVICDRCGTVTFKMDDLTDFTLGSNFDNFPLLCKKFGFSEENPLGVFNDMSPEKDKDLDDTTTVLGTKKRKGMSVHLCEECSSHMLHAMDAFLVGARLEVHDDPALEDIQTFSFADLPRKVEI